MYIRQDKKKRQHSVLPARIEQKEEKTLPHPNNSNNLNNQVSPFSSWLSNVLVRLVVNGIEIMDMVDRESRRPVNASFFQYHNRSMRSFGFAPYDLYIPAFPPQFERKIDTVFARPPHQENELSISKALSEMQCFSNALTPFSQVDKFDVVQTMQIQLKEGAIVCPISMEEVTSANGFKPDTCMIVERQKDNKKIHLSFFQKAALAKWFQEKRDWINPINRQRVAPQNVVWLS
jgi:hypothetical protein